MSTRFGARSSTKTSQSSSQSGWRTDQESKPPEGKFSGTSKSSQSGWRSDRWVKPFFRQYRGALVLALFLGVMTFVFASALMFNSGYLISKAAEAPGNIMVIYLPIALARIFGVGKPFLRYLERLTSHNWILRMTSKLRLKLYKVLEKDAIFIKQRMRTGDILGLLAEDIGHIQDLYLRTIFPTIIAWVLAVLLVVILGMFSLWFALFMGLMLFVVVVLVPLVSALVNGVRMSRGKAMKNELYVQLTDNILGVSDWIIAGRSNEYLQSYKASEDALRGVNARMNRSSRNRNVLLQVLYSIVVAALLLWAGSAFGGGYAGMANWIAAFVLAFFPLIDAFAPLPDAAIETNKYRDSLSRLDELPDEAEGSISKTKKMPQAPLTLNVDELEFEYPGTTRLVLDGLTLTIAPGERIAILGRSGSGKSTLAALMRGDLSPTKGTVTINGVPTDELGDDITRYIGVIQQQTYLFNTTLAENLKIGNKSATDAELWKALENVGLSSMVRRLPEGLETLVDEAGLRFSGGERHRIALARVLLCNVPIVILDEPTVGLDPVSEQALLHTFFKTMQDKTVIMITHHLEGVALVDRVIFIEDGKLKLCGTPEELAKSNAYYQKLQAFDTGV